MNAVGDLPVFARRQGCRCYLLQCIGSRRTRRCGRWGDEPNCKLEVPHDPSRARTGFSPHWDGERQPTSRPARPSTSPSEQHRKSGRVGHSFRRAASANWRTSWGRRARRLPATLHRGKWLTRLRQGKSNGAIARELNRSEITVQG
jgi:hypothetical protein